MWPENDFISRSPEFHLTASGLRARVLWLRSLRLGFSILTVRTPGLGGSVTQADFFLGGRRPAPVASRFIRMSAFVVFPLLTVLLRRLPKLPVHRVRPRSSPASLIRPSCDLIRLIGWTVARPRPPALSPIEPILTAISSAVSAVFLPLSTPGRPHVTIVASVAAVPPGTSSRLCAGTIFLIVAFVRRAVTPIP